MSHLCGKNPESWDLDPLQALTFQERMNIYFMFSQQRGKVLTNSFETFSIRAKACNKFRICFEKQACSSLYN
jgi:hypothetical protein